MYPITTYYNIPQLDYETNERYAHRCWFVNKQNPKTLTELRQAIKWSLVESYMTYDKCIYPDEVTDLIERMKLNKLHC